MTNFKTITTEIQPDGAAVAIFQDIDGTTPDSVELVLPDGWAVAETASWFKDEYKFVCDIDMLYPDQACKVLMLTGIMGYFLTAQHNSPVDPEKSWMKSFLIVKEGNEQAARDILIAEPDPLD